MMIALACARRSWFLRRRLMTLATASAARRSGLVYLVAHPYARPSAALRRRWSRCSGSDQFGGLSSRGHEPRLGQRAQGTAGAVNLRANTMLGLAIDASRVGIEAIPITRSRCPANRRVLGAGLTLCGCGRANAARWSALVPHGARRALGPVLWPCTRRWPYVLAASDLTRAVPPRRVAGISRAVRFPRARYNRWRSSSLVRHRALVLSLLSRRSARRCRDPRRACGSAAGDCARRED